MEDFEQEIARLNSKLDNLELEIAMSQEALESIEMRLRLLNTELDFESEGPTNDV
jgi:archaellum component FlaC